MKRYDDNNIECQKHTLLASIEFHEKKLKEAKKAFTYYVNRVILDGCGIDIDSMNKARGERIKKEYEERQKAI